MIDRLDGLHPPDLSDDEIAWLLVEIATRRAGLAQVATDLEAELAKRHGSRKWVVPNLGEVKVRRKTKRTGWRHDELLPVLIARIMDEPATLFDRETGELLPYVQIGHNLTARLRQCVSFGAGKVTGLLALNLEPGEFCHEEADGYQVTLPPRDVI